MNPMVWMFIWRTILTFLNNMYFLRRGVISSTSKLQVRRIGTGGGLLWTRQRTFGFHAMLGNSSADERLLASQEGLDSVELVPSSRNAQSSRYCYLFGFSTKRNVELSMCLIN
jgi:hypothetical protein